MSCNWGGGFRLAADAGADAAAVARRLLTLETEHFSDIEYKPP